MPTTKGFNAPKRFDLSTNIYKERMDYFREAAEAVISGHYLACFCSGPPGVGKTFVIDQLEKACRPRVNIVRAKLDAAHFADIMFENRFDNCVIFIDDRQGMFDSPAVVELLLGACDTGQERRTILDTRFQPPRGNGLGTFVFRGRFIIVQNKNIFADDFVPPDKKNLDKLEALKSRLAYNKVTMPTDDAHVVDLYNYVCWVMCANYKFREYGLRPEESNETLAYFANNFYGFRKPGIRTLDALAKSRAVMKSYKKNWEEQLQEGWSDLQFSRQMSKPQLPHWTIGKPPPQLSTPGVAQLMEKLGPDYQELIYKAQRDGVKARIFKPESSS